MPERQPDVLNFLLSRRSRPAKTLGPQGPDRAELTVLLTAASRTPDHGKLVPWRFVVLSDAEVRETLVTLSAAHMQRMGLDQGKIDKNAGAFRQGGAVVVVIASPKPSEKIPAWEQEIASGGVCLALLNAALASGWGANWLTGPLAREAAFLREAFDCTDTEFVAGFIHIGNELVAPTDRDRPDIDALTVWR